MTGKVRAVFSGSPRYPKGTLPCWASHPLPSCPGSNTNDSVSSTTTVPGPGKNEPTSTSSIDVTCIWAPVSEDPAESEMTRLGMRSTAMARTAGVSGGPPAVPDGEERREVVLLLVELHEQWAQHRVADDGDRRRLLALDHRPHVI